MRLKNVTGMRVESVPIVRRIKMVNLLAEDQRMMKHIYRNHRTGDYNALINKKRKEEYLARTCKINLSNEHKTVPRLIKPKPGRKKTVMFVEGCL